MLEHREPIHAHVYTYMCTDVRMGLHTHIYVFFHKVAIGYIWPEETILAQRDYR